MNNWIKSVLITLGVVTTFCSIIVLSQFYPIILGILIFIVGIAGLILYIKNRLDEADEYKRFKEEMDKAENERWNKFEENIREIRSVVKQN